MTGRREAASDDDAARVLFDTVAEPYVTRAGVSLGRIWHNEGLTVGGRIFAMVVRGELVVKVPAAQAAELVESGVASPFEPSPGRRMREWVAVPPPAAGGPTRQRQGDLWQRLVADAFAYVGRTHPP